MVYSDGDHDIKQPLGTVGYILCVCVGMCTVC